jgi:hypothetical protein
MRAVAGGLSPRWVTAFLLVALSTRILEILTGGSRLFFERLASTESAVQAIILLGGIFALSVCGFLLCVILGVTELQFLPLFALIVHAEAILVTRGMVNLVLMAFRAPVLHPGAEYLPAVPGLDLFAGSSTVNAGLLYFLNGLNPFSIWYCVTLAVGMHADTGIPKQKAFLVASFLLLLRVGVPAILLWIAASAGRE